jgi:hypothetical protein
VVRLDKLEIPLKEFKELIRKGKSPEPGILAIRVCSPNKVMIEGSLKEIYQDPMLQAFFTKMRLLRIPYALLSIWYST